MGRQRAHTQIPANFSHRALGIHCKQRTHLLCQKEALNLEEVLSTNTRMERSATQIR